MKRINLLGPRVPAVSASATGRRLMVTSVCGWCIAATWIGAAATRCALLQVTIAQHESRIPAMRANHDRVEALRREADALGEEARWLEGATRSIPADYSLATLGRAIPDGAVLTRVSIAQPAGMKAEATKTPPTGSQTACEIRIDGLAINSAIIAKTLRILGESPSFRAARLLETRTAEVGGHQVLRFSAAVPIEEPDCGSDERGVR